MSINEKVIHLRYTNLSNIEDLSFTWEGDAFTLVFRHKSFDDGKAYMIKGPKRKAAPANLLLWLSVYVGEDAVDPHREKDTRPITAEYRGVRIIEVSTSNPR